MNPLGFTMRPLPVALVALALGVPVVAAQDGACVTGLVAEPDHHAVAVTLTWDAAPGASSIVVAREQDSGGWAVIATLPGESTSFHDEDFPANGALASYRVGVDGEPGEDCPTVTVHLHGHGGHDGGDSGEPTCATGLVATPRADGAIVLAWDAAPGDATFDVLRAEGDAALAPHAVTSSTEFVDVATVPGVTFRYAVTVNGLVPDPEACPVAEATAIPFLGSPLALALAAVGGVGAVAWARRT